MQNKFYLKQALQLAEIRRGFCAPNPAVGAVVVKDNHVLGTGYHYASGHPHAEVEAVKNISPDQLNGATIYITLEPCCHFGKTPPCTDLLIRSGIKRVVYAMRDPNPQVANKSEIILKNVGIEVIYLPLSEITEFYQSYQHWWQTKKPYVTAKLALSLDGKIAGANGERINITGAAAQRFTHQQRKRSDAILTTAKTIIHDDPLLNVRLIDETIKKPIYILDSQLNTPLNAKLFATAANIILFHAENAAHKAEVYLAKGAQCIAVAANAEGLNLIEVLNHIGAQGIHDLWIEAGGKCFASFVTQNLLQRAYLYVAPKWLGDKAQTAFQTTPSIFTQAKKITWKSLEGDAACEIIF